MQKSKIDVTKILIVPFFGSKNHNISAIVFQKAQQKGTIGVAGHHFMIFPPQHFVFTWWRKAAHPPSLHFKLTVAKVPDSLMACGNIKNP